MRDKTVNSALRTHGYDTKEQVTGHGFRSTARTLIEEGCRVTICARGEDGIASAVENLRKMPGVAERVLAVQADLSTEKGVADVVLRTVETFGGLDILVNNVGLAKGSDIVQTSDAEWHEAFESYKLAMQRMFKGGRMKHAQYTPTVVVAAKTR